MHPELALRWQQFHVAPAMQQPSITVSTPLQQILKICAMKGYSQSFRITCDVSAVSLLESREYIKAINNNNVLTILSWADLLLLFFVLKDLVWKSVTCSCNSFFSFLLMMTTPFALPVAMLLIWTVQGLPAWLQQSVCLRISQPSSLPCVLPGAWAGGGALCRYHTLYKTEWHLQSCRCLTLFEAGSQ